MSYRFALLAALAVASAVPAAATETLHVSQGGIFNPGQVHASGSPSGTYYSSVIRLTGTETGSNDPFDIWAFCVDLAHTINVGINSMANISYNYATGPLATDGYGHALSSAQIQQMSGLASLGFTIAKGDAPDRALKLAAVQGAIWQIEYPNATIASNNSFAGLDAKIAEYVALAPTLNGKAQYLYSLSNPQSQGFLTSFVPEPATWAMMIAGFGLVGIAARRRQSGMAVTA
jgi:hypothetical protein